MEELSAVADRRVRLESAAQLCQVVPEAGETLVALVAGAVGRQLGEDVSL